MGLGVGDGAEGVEVCCGLGLDDDVGEAEKYEVEDSEVGDGFDGGGVEGAFTTCCDEESEVCMACACGIASNCFTATGSA